MTAPDMDDIKEIPGYKVILRAVIKAQIQQLVEQLASEADEESVMLTANVNDATLNYLGSESGTSFINVYADIKKDFLGFCLGHNSKPVDILPAKSAVPCVPLPPGVQYKIQIPRLSNDPKAVKKLPKILPKSRHSPYISCPRHERPSSTNTTSSNQPQAKLPIPQSDTSLTPAEGPETETSAEYIVIKQEIINDDVDVELDTEADLEQNQAVKLDADRSVSNERDAVGEGSAESGRVSEMNVKLEEHDTSSGKFQLEISDHSVSMDLSTEEISGHAKFQDDFQGEQSTSAKSSYMSRYPFKSQTPEDMARLIMKGMEIDGARKGTKNSLPDHPICPFCEKSFTNKSNLVRHMRLHTGDKPYRCEICFREFTQSTAKNKHMAMHMNYTS